MPSEKKESGIVGQIAVGILVALVAGGTSPWWWDKFFGSGNQSRQPSQTTSPTVSTTPSSSTNVPTTSPIDNSKGTTQQTSSPDKPPPSSPTPIPTPNASALNPNPKLNEGILFQLKSCRNENETIKCEFLVTDQTENRKLTIYGRRKSKIIDPQGNEYLVETVRFGSATANGIVNQNLAQGIGLTAFISFENVPTQVNQLALVEVSAYTKRQGDFTIQFRDIPVLN